MSIITVSRQYGSGGKELAERLAKQLNYDYYDKNVITEIAKKTSLDEKYVKSNIEKSATAYPSHFGRGSFYSPIIAEGAITVAVAQREILKSLAKKGNAVFVGRAADLILSEFKPFNIFVCADNAARIARLKRVIDGFDKLSDKEVQRKMLSIDKERAKCREMYSDTKWGDPLTYHLIVNTTGADIKSLVPALADYVLGWFNGK